MDEKSVSSSSNETDVNVSVSAICPLSSCQISCHCRLTTPYQIPAAQKQFQQLTVVKMVSRNLDSSLSTKIRLSAQAGAKFIMLG